MEAATPSCARSGLGLEVVAESPILIGTERPKNSCTLRHTAMTLCIIDVGAARRDRRYKHDMTKEERKSLRLTASAYCLRLRTHNGGQSELPWTPKVKAAKTLMRSRSVGAGGGERGQRSTVPSLGRPLVRPRTAGCSGAGQCSPSQGSPAKAGCL
jgi:hypothetical protein